MAKRLGVIDEQGGCGQSDGLATECVFEGRRVMHFQSRDTIGADSFEQTGQVASRYGVMRFGAAILARVAKIGHERRDPCGAGVLQRTDEEEQSTKLIVGACSRTAVEALDDIDVGSADSFQRTHLMFAVFEFSLFVCRQRLPESLRYGLAEIGSRLQCKEPKPSGVGQTWSGIARGPKALFHHHGLRPFLNLRSRT